MSTKIIIKNYPYPPSLNQSYPTNKQGRRFPSPKLKAFKNDCLIWDKTNQGIRPQIEILKRAIATDQMFVVIDIIFSIPSTEIWTQKYTLKRNDCDNRIKALFDSLAQTIGIDDKYFVIGSCFKCYNNEHEYKTILAIDYTGIKHESEQIKDIL